jgi:hypothetical protein
MSMHDDNPASVPPSPEAASATARAIAPETPESDGEDEEQPSISGRGCLLVIIASVVVSILIYQFGLSSNPDTRGPAYMAASALFGFFMVGIIWGVAQQQRESDRARDAEETAPDSMGKP